MNSIRTDAMVDEALARAVPALRPLLGKHIELIALDLSRAVTPARRLAFDAFLATRLTRPEGVAPVWLEDMERAVEEGAAGRAFR